MQQLSERGIPETAGTGAAIRLFHLTFYKCGSQWVRDILADGRIRAYSGHELAVGGVDLQGEKWPQLQRGQLASPLYSAGAGDWARIAAPDDRALVVLRDPRDIVVSLVYSMSFSHTPNPVSNLLRKPMSEASPANRIRLGMFLLAQWSEYLRTWKDAHQFPNVYCTRYEWLLSDLAGEMRRMFAFLDWEIPDAVIQQVADDNAFAARSGRPSGVENEFSHRRKGIAGDWRNHFDRILGELFEATFPDLLTSLEYEQTCDWWRELPAANEAASKTEPKQEHLLGVLAEHQQELSGLRSAVEQLPAAAEAVNTAERQQEHLLAVLAEHQQELAVLRTAVAELPAAAEAVNRAERREQHLLAVLAEHQREVAVLRGAAEERLTALQAGESARRAIERSYSWRFGFLPLRTLLSLFAK